MSFLTIISMLIGSIAASGPPMFMKFYTKDSNIYWVNLSIIFYIILIIVYSIIFTGPVLSTYILLNVITIIIIAVWEFSIYGNTLDMTSGFGIGFGIISIGLLSSKIIQSTPEITYV